MRIHYTYHGQKKAIDVERKEVLVGRLSPLSSPDLDLGNDPTVSRKHCRIKQTGKGLVVEDLRSTNGTVVDQDYVETKTVSAKSVIRVGETDITLELQEKGASAPPAKPKVPRSSPLNPSPSAKPSSILPPKGQKPGTAPTPAPGSAKSPQGILPTGGPGSSPKPAAPDAQKPVPKPEVKKDAPAKPKAPSRPAAQAAPEQSGETKEERKLKPTPPANSSMLERVTPKFPRSVQKALLNELESDKLKPAGRKDDLPVLFAELTGFQAVGNEMPVDTATEMMSDYFSVLQTAIFKYDGTIDRFGGDGMVVLFGAPVDDEKRNEKSVVAAIAMRDAIRDLNMKRVQNGGNIWHLRVGVNLGTVFHGFVGVPERMNFTVVGPGLNRATGFCKGAENGEVLIGPELYQKVFKIVEADRSTVTHKEYGEFHCYRVKGLKKK